MESSWYGADKITRSKQRLDRLQYFSDVNLETPAVPGTSDQVDVNVKVTEKSTGSIMFGAGLSSYEGIVLGVTVNQNNFLGTGNRVAAQVNTGKINTVYSLSYTDPYFTPDGISRTFNIYHRDVNTKILRTGTYQTSSYGGGMSFGMPLNERDSVSAGLSFDYTKVSLDATSPQRYKRYCGALDSLGCENYSYMLNLGWAHDTRDSTLYPREGVFQRLSAEIGLPGLDLEYYKLDYKHSWYQPINSSMTFMLNGEIGYGDTYGSKEFPYFKNYYVGGVNSVRGYDTSAIGPYAGPTTVNGVTSYGYFEGGTKRVVGNAEIYFPVPGMKDSSQLRLSTFIDAGNVYTSEQSVSLGDLRYSAGAGISWYSPFGPIKLVFAKALNPQPTDRTQMIQFQMGSQF
jgi:outer membrane protein insertion porin family